MTQSNHDNFAIRSHSVQGFKEGARRRLTRRWVSITAYKPSIEFGAGQIHLVAKDFVAEHGRAVVKPLDGMGGRSIFVVNHGDKNANVIFETLTDYGTQFAMAQQFIAEIAAAVGRELTDGDRRVCDIVGPVLKERGVLFCGIDVIGDYMTEVNVTSPTGIRELDQQFDLNIAGTLFDAIESRI